MLSALSSADLEDSDYQGNTAVHIAAERGHAEVLACILSQTSTPVDALLSQRNAEGNTPLHLAARKGHVDGLQAMLTMDVGLECASLPNEVGATALHLAAEEGNFHAVQALLNAEAAATKGQRKLVGEVDQMGNTPLHYAARSGRLETVELLLARGADVDACNASDETALHLAAAWNEVAVVQRLLDCGASPQAFNFEGKTPIDVARGRGLTDLWQTMVGRQLVKAAQAGDEPGVHAALHDGALIDLKDPITGDTALHVAARYGRSGVIRLLLQRGAARGVENDVGDTPLHTAARSGEAQAVEAFLDCGDDPNRETSEGDTPLHVAAREGWVSVIEALARRGAVVGLLGAGRSTALHEAAAGGRLEVVQALLRLGADPNAKEGLGGNTCLHVAMVWCPPDEKDAVIRALNDAGANPETVNEEGLTPDVMASRMGYSTVSEHLTSCTCPRPSAQGSPGAVLLSVDQDLMTFESGSVVMAPQEGATLPMPPTPDLQLSDANGHAATHVTSSLQAPTGNVPALEIPGHLDGMVPQRPPPPPPPPVPVQTQQEPFYPVINFSLQESAEQRPEDGQQVVFQPLRRVAHPDPAPVASPFAAALGPAIVDHAPAVQVPSSLFSAAAAQIAPPRPPQEAALAPEPAPGVGSGSLSGSLTEYEKLRIQPSALRLEDMVIGTGSFGRIFRGRYFGALVAVKQLKPLSPGLPGAAAPTQQDPSPSFVRELAVMARMRFENIQDLNGFCEHPEHGLVLVSKYYARGSLAAVLKDGLRKPRCAEQLHWSRRLRLAHDIAKGLSYMHGQNPPIIHRDLKAINCFIDDAWKAVVGDFGLTREAASSDPNRMAQSSGPAANAVQCCCLFISSIVWCFSFSAAVCAAGQGREAAHPRPFPPARSQRGQRAVPFHRRTGSFHSVDAALLGAGSWGQAPYRGGAGGS